MLHWFKHASERKSAAISAPAPWLFELFGSAPTAAGKHITPVSALRVPAVACAVKAISDTVGTLPCKVFRRTEGGGKEQDPNHPAFELVHSWASDWQSAGALRKQVTVDALLEGNGYALANKVTGRAIELIRLDPKCVTPRENEVTGEPQYLYRSRAGVERVYAYDEIIHIAGLSLNGLKGEAAIQIGRETIGIASAVQEHVARLFSNGAKPGGILRTEKNLNEVAINNIRKLLEAQHAGSSNAGKAIILTDGFDYTQTALTSVDAQLIEIWRLVIEEVARLFRIPPMIIMDYGRATWNNSEAAAKEWLASLLEWLRQWQAGYVRTLLSREERKTHIVDFITDDLLRADFAARTEGYTKLIAARVVNPNEVRAKENMPPYEGGDAFVNPNIAPAPAAGGR
ncbi:MAG: phage portal protein [Pseudorhodoplanes sp.]|jgi:HK97 family phage portal protein|nr:phage portal protein [Pseudorhodoplanes sp.]